MEQVSKYGDRRNQQIAYSIGRRNLKCSCHIYIYISVGRGIMCHSNLAVTLKLKTKSTFHVISMLYSIFRKNASVSLEKISGLFLLGWLNEVG
jgi:hypothetical protein